MSYIQVYHIPQKMWIWYNVTYMVDDQKSRILSPERRLEAEQIKEQPKERLEFGAEKIVVPPSEKPRGVPPPVPTRPAMAPPKEPELVKIENILEENLKEVYASLPADIKPKFKAKGEETATKIRELMEKTKVKARKILKLIKAWLKLIPGVNKFFLEQEAAIKTQKLMAMKNKINDD